MTTLPFLVHLVIALAVIGLLLWAVDQVPMDPTVAKIIRVVTIVVLCLWLLRELGFVSVFR